MSTHKIGFGAKLKITMKYHLIIWIYRCAEQKHPFSPD